MSMVFKPDTSTLEALINVPYTTPGKQNTHNNKKDSIKKTPNLDGTN